MRSLEEVENYFSYHAPDANARAIHEEINDIFMKAARELWKVVTPENRPSPDKTVMFRALSDARMQANMTVACFNPAMPAVSSPDNSAALDPQRRPSSGA